MGICSRGKCCGIRLRGSVPQPQSSSLALPCQILVSVDGCQSLTAFGSCIHWMTVDFSNTFEKFSLPQADRIALRAIRLATPSRRPKTPAGTVGKRVPYGHNRRRRLATRRCDTKRAGTTAVVPATIEWQHCLLHLHFFDTLSRGYARHTVKTAVSAHPAARRHFTLASAVAPVVYTSSSSRIFSPVKSRTAAKAPSMAVSRWARFRST